MPGSPIRLLFKVLPKRYHPAAFSVTMLVCGVNLLVLSYQTLDHARRHQSPTDVPLALMILLEALVAGLGVCALVLGITGLRGLRALLGLRENNDKQ